MEQHPVPQNVTTFQFRLIGDMTLKQFGYLAGGAILAYISYKLPLPFIITWPLAVTFAAGGFGFAFVPIEERPMDVWVLSFIKNVYSPTQYVWQRIPALADPGPSSLSAFPALPNIIPLPKSPMATQTPSRPTAVALPASVPTQQPANNASPLPSVPQPIRQQPAPTAPQPQSSSGFFAWIDNLFVSHPQNAVPPQPVPVRSPPVQHPLPPRQADRPVIAQPIPQPVAQAIPRPVPPVQRQVPPVIPSWTPPVGPIPSIVGSKPDLPEAPPARQQPGFSAAPGSAPSAPASREQEMKMKQLEDQLAALQQQLQQKTQIEEKYKQMQQQVTEVTTQKRSLENEVVAMKKQSMTAPAPQTYKTAGVVQDAKRPTVRVFTPDAAIKAGLPRLTSFPNVVTGIIKDFDNNLLPGVLVTVRDPEGVPVRALKTNKLGQFAASTPLPNGTYVVEVEDPRGRYIFDRVQFALTGVVMPAIEIVAKSKKELDRADLEKKIFGQPM